MSKRKQKQDQAVERLRYVCGRLVEQGEAYPEDADLILDGIRDGLRDLAFDDFFGTDPSWLLGDES